MGNKSRALKIEGIMAEEYCNEGRNVPETVAGMLTDVRHFCTEADVDFYLALKQSYRNYLDEIKGGDIT